MGIDQTNHVGKILPLPSVDDAAAWRGIVNELSTRLGQMEGKQAALEIERFALLREVEDLRKDCRRQVNRVNTIAGRATAAAERIEQAIHRMRSGA